MIGSVLDQCPQFALGSQRADWPQPGERFLGYDVVELLGSGALARVYLAREPALGQRLVVIKVSRFGAAEAETLGKLSHPNIVPIHSVQHDSVTGWTAICMPLLGTATAVDLLDAAFAAGPPQSGTVIARVALAARPIRELPPLVAGEESRQWRGPYADAIARLGMQLAEGLHAAHTAGVRHHDIKPSNVLLAWTGQPMLLDFNLSTDASAATERIGGTLPYMAPELIASLVASRGRAALRLDPRSEIYSLGAVLYELLSGQLPARPSGADKLPSDAYQPWLQCKQLPPTSLRSLNSAIDRRLDAIVLRCLAFDPAERFASAAELAAELRAYLSLPQAARRFVGHNRRGFSPSAAWLSPSVAAFVARPAVSSRWRRGCSRTTRQLLGRRDLRRCVDLDRSFTALPATRRYSG
jgi:serine/threonine protein kinase